jgi:hypothetical protein
MQTPIIGCAFDRTIISTLKPVVSHIASTAYLSFKSSVNQAENRP